MLIPIEWRNEGFMSMLSPIEWRNEGSMATDADSGQMPSGAQLQNCMRDAPSMDRPVTKFVFAEVREFVDNLLEGVTMEGVLQLSHSAGLMLEWIQCRLRCLIPRESF
eukprot:3742307-Pyramimonas_sp.AAC.2